MRKKLITYFLLLVMGIQILPVQQIGGMLFNNQFTEECPHSLDIDKEGYHKAGHKSMFLDTQSFILITALSELSFRYIHFADAIPLNHGADILVPPPNC
jgi:hypothetical protein